MKAFHAVLWILALGTGLAACAAAFPGRLAPHPSEAAPVSRHFLTWGQTPEQGQSSAGQAHPAAEQGQTTTRSEPQSPGTDQSDGTVAGIQAALANLSSPDLGAIGRAFDTTVRKRGEAAKGSSTVELIELGDLDGDGIPEIALRVQGAEESLAAVQSPASPASWRGLYLLSWDGTRWEASSLSASGQDSRFKVVRLGPGGYLAVVNTVGEGALPYPEVFQVKDHKAALVWDSQGEDSRYNALEHGQIEFQDDPKDGQTEMIVTGRADPGLLEFEPGGRRGFNAQCVYHWDGQAYVPVRTEYSPGPDNSLYRFIAALHLHDFRSAYARIDPGRFLNTDAPSLEQFRRAVETSWLEFLDDQIFEAREAPAGSPDALAFELPEKHYVYRPTLSDDGKFLLRGLERKVEIPATEPSGDSR